jgi:hypothetical protein
MSDQMTTAAAHKVTHEKGNPEAWNCTCGDTDFMPCDAQGNEQEPDEGWEGHYRCSGCGHHFHMDSVVEGSVFDISKMSRAEKYELASKIISDISNEWTDAEDSEQWQKENVEEYECRMSFDEVAALVRAVTFRRDDASPSA